MNIETDPRVAKEINKLNLTDRAKIREYIDLFREYGFTLGPSPKHIIIHLMYKQSQQMTKKTKKILNQRAKEYL